MTTQINIAACFENPQSALISAFRQRRLLDFKFALENLQADPNAVDPVSHLTIFETVLSTPETSDYITLCIDNGADLYKINNRRKYPLHFAVESLCPENLKVFLKFYDQRKINVKFVDQNSLHLLMEMLPGGDDYDKITECIKILILNGCDPNTPNQKSRTPFFSLLRVQPKLSKPNELVDFILENSEVDIYTFKGADMKRMFEKQNPHQKLPEKVDRAVDTELMTSLLSTKTESEFENKFGIFKQNSTNKPTNDANEDNKNNRFAEDCAKFLYFAVQRNLENVVEFLVSEKVDVNKKPAGADHQSLPIFLACKSGYYKIVQALLQADPKPKTSAGNKNLLHEVAHHFGVKKSLDPTVDHQKCFDLVLDHCDVNAKDDQNCTPLHYAVRYQNNEAVIALLEKSSYIGTENIFGETPVTDMKREVLEDFLDSCITTNVRKTGEDEPEIYIDYKFLKAPKAPGDDEYGFEVTPLEKIAKNSDLRPLIQHPVISSFIFLKWTKLTMLFYTNLLFFTLLMTSVIVFIVLCHSIPEDERSQSGAYNLFFFLSCLGVIGLMIREITQFCLSPIRHLKSPINWFELVLIVLTWIVLLSPDQGDEDDSTLRVLRAITILLAAYEFLILVGNLPMLSVSTYMTILKKVAMSFLKLFVLAGILLFAFAFSFYTLFGKRHDKVEDATTVKPDSSVSSGCCKDDDDDEFNSFGYPGIAIIKTFVMLTGEFDASALDLDRHPIYSIIFALFVFVITIVLFNLLNALAVDDTQVIKSEGQLVDLCQRIKELSKYEKIILSRKNCWEYLKSVITLFPFTIPDGKIVIRPNRRNEILLNRPRKSSRDVSIKIEDGQAQELENLNKNSSVDRIIPNIRVKHTLEKYSRMDSKVMKAIRNVIDQRNEKQLSEQRDQMLWTHIKSLESQLKILTELMMKKK